MLLFAGRSFQGLDQRVTVLGAVFEWEDFGCKDGDVLNIQGMACHLVRGKIRFPDTPGLVAKVAGTTTPKSGFWEGRTNGTHVMLCRDVDEKTSDTVAIKVSGDIEGGLVQREDGYVLELHRWVKGDTRLLKGRQWTIFWSVSQSVSQHLKPLVSGAVSLKFLFNETLDSEV